MTIPTARSASLEGFGLTTAQIVYHLPDNYAVLQEFLWQEYDLFPDFPGLERFLAFWEEEIEGSLHSVTVAHRRLIRPTAFSALRSATRH
jgi:uncharacterized protein Usg